MKPHKHKDLIIAWANGANIQFKYEDEWIDFDNDETPSWKEYSEYRIKPPEPKPDYLVNGDVYYQIKGADYGVVQRLSVTVIIDSETNEPKALRFV